MSSQVLTHAVSAKGLGFTTSHIMNDKRDATSVYVAMRCTLAPKTNLTQRRAGTLAKQLLDACHNHAAKMSPRGRTSTRFWIAVRSDVAWVRCLGIAVVEEFALALAEAARLELKKKRPDLYRAMIFAIHRDQPVNVTNMPLNGYPAVSKAAVQFLADVKTYKKHFDHRGDYAVSALRGRVPDSKGKPSKDWIPLFSPAYVE